MIQSTNFLKWAPLNQPVLHRASSFAHFSALAKQDLLFGAQKPLWALWDHGSNERGRHTAPELQGMDCPDLYFVSADPWWCHNINLKLYETNDPNITLQVNAGN